MSPVTLQVLYIAADGADEPRLAAALQAAGYTPIIHRVADGAALLAAPPCECDLVLLHVGPRDANARVALAALREARCDVPVIAVTAREHAEAALAALGQGACDYVELEDLRRLGPAVAREAQAAVDRRTHRSTRATLALAEERFRTVSELGSDAAYAARVDPDGTVVIEWATDSLTRITGYQPNEVVEPNMWQRAVHPDDVPLLYQRLQEHLAGKPAALEYRILTRDGAVRWIQDYAYPLWDESQDRVTRIAGAVRDITDAKRAEATLLESEQRYRELFAEARDAILLVDDHGRCVDANLAAEELTGFTRAELAARPARDLTSPVAVPQGDALREVLQHIGHVTCEYVIRAKDGRDILTDVSITRLEQGTFLAIFRDVTARKRMETDLRASEQRFRALVERAADAVFLYDQAGTILDVNQQACVSLGYSRDELLWMRVWDFAVGQSPEDMTRLWAQLVDHSPLTTEGRHRRKDGSVFPVELRVGILESQGDRLILALARDVTERKQAEAALRASEQKLRGIFEWSLDGIMLVSEQGRIVEWNAGMQRITGLGAGQAVGREVWDVAFDMLPAEQRTPDWLAAAREEASGLISTGRWPRGDASREQELVRPDGERRTVQVITFSIPAASGFYLCSIIRDVTEQQEAAAALLQSRERLRRRAAVLQALYDMALQLNAQLAPAALLRLIVDQAAALLEAQAGGLFLYHPEVDALRLEVGVGYFRAEPPLLLKVEEGLSGKVFASRQSLVIDDYTAWAGHAPDHASVAHLKAMLGVPLVRGERVLGALTILSDVRRFDENDVWLAELFAAQAAAALESAGLHAQLERRAREQAALNAAGQVLTGTLELPDVLDAVIAEVKALLNASAASVLLSDRTAGSLSFAAAAGPDAALLVGQRLPPGEGIAGWILRERRSALVNDAQNDPRFYRDINSVTGVAARSVLGVPLIAHGDVMGVIEAVHRETNAFTAQDLATLEAMAPSAAIAIDNARLYQDLREQYRRLEQSQAQLVRSEKLAALGRLIASLAHEMNNPLQAMQNSLELILDFPLDAAEQREYLLALRRETERLTRISNRVLDFARPPDLERQPLDVAAAVEYALTLAGRQLERSGVEVRVDLPAGLPRVLASHDRLAQVFLNLIINASEALARGGRLCIAGRVVAGQLELTFSDNGPGIPPEALPLIFEPLYTTKQTGTGLGLPICHNIVEQHGGTIVAGNAPGGGAVFTVRLPVAE